MICCHQKCFRLRMFNSARMTACKVVEGTPHNRLRYNMYFCCNCLRILLAAESVGPCMPRTGQPWWKAGARMDWNKQNFRQTESLHCNCACFCCTFAQDAVAGISFGVMRWLIWSDWWKGRPKYLKLSTCSKGWFVHVKVCYGHQHWSQLLSLLYWLAYVALDNGLPVLWWVPVEVKGDVPIIRPYQHTPCRWVMCAQSWCMWRTETCRW